MLRPSTAKALPEIRDGGTTIVVRIRPGIHFTPDPVFKGKPRELIAEDYVYSWKRLIDPRMRSFWSFYLDGKLVGADELVAAAKASGRFDYDAKLEGLQALDRYTLQIKLKQPDYMLLEFMTTRVMAAVAREVVEAYGSPAERLDDGPSGGHRAVHAQGVEARQQDRARARIPTIATTAFPTRSTRAKPHAVRANAGKRLPLVDQVEVSIIEESESTAARVRLRSARLPARALNLVDKRAGRRQAQARVREQGMRCDPRARVGVHVHVLQHGRSGRRRLHARTRVALRRAIAMAYDVGDEIRVIRKGQADPGDADDPAGTDRPRSRRDERIVLRPGRRAGAARPLRLQGRGADGYRERPDGSPLVLKLGSPPSSEDREFDELWKRSMDAVGIRIEFVKQKWQDLLKMSTAGQLQMLRLARLFTLRDGGAALEILYGKNIGNGMNDAHFSLPEFDALFEQARALPDGA